jgi:hypothetical protein
MVEQCQLRPKQTQPEWPASRKWHLNKNASSQMCSVRITGHTENASGSSGRPQLCTECRPHVRSKQDSSPEYRRIAGAKGCYQQLSCARLARMLPQHADFSSTWIGYVASRVRLRKPFLESWDQRHRSKVSFRGTIDSTIPSPEISEEGPSNSRAAHSNHSCAARAASSNALIAMR